MLREAHEEIGIKPEELASKLNKIMTVEVDFSKFGRNGRYFIHEYIAYLEHPLSYYHKQDEEVDKLFFMNYEEIKNRVRNKDKQMRIIYNKETDEFFYKLDENLYNLGKNKRGELECEEK